MSSVSRLHLIIGDVNDNPMAPGSSKIFVYNYEGKAPDTEIGRVYVDDPDDWDLIDKSFEWDGIPHDRFRLNNATGMITMLEHTSEGEYLLNFIVTEDSDYTGRHKVDAQVHVTVKEIPDEAVDKSGSIRFYNMTAEDFIKVSRDAEPGTLSLKDRFQYSLARILNVSYENVDVFTVLNYNNTLDVRFSAHGSPYYAAEKLNGMVAQNQHKIEHELNLQMLMINIDECLIEKVNVNHHVQIFYINRMFHYLFIRIRHHLLG